jgi:sec-independent protein translocase protein TatC
MSNEGSMGFLEHIEELRARVMRALIGLFIGTVICAFFAERILSWLTRPLPGDGLAQLEAISLTENMGVFMQASLLGGVTLAMPYILYQLWRYVDPALRADERKYVFLIVPFATLLFLSGVAFCYFVMLPVAVPFLLEFLTIPVTPRPSEYFPFITSILFWIGISFETPLVIFFLAKVRVLSHRTLLKNWRVAVILIAVLAAVITPTPDPVNMGIVMLPMIVLYGLSIVLAWIAYRPGEAEA